MTAGALRHPAALPVRFELMSTVITIPLTTLPVGSFTAGPAAVADTTTDIVLVIQRDVVNGFNSQPATTTAELDMFQSDDGGTSWHGLAGTLIEGGLIPAKGGGNLTQSTVETTLNPGTGREVKAIVTVAGSSVAVSGTLTIT